MMTSSPSINVNLRLPLTSDVRTYLEATVRDLAAVSRQLSCPCTKGLLLCAVCTKHGGDLPALLARFRQVLEADDAVLAETMGFFGPKTGATSVAGSVDNGEETCSKI